MFKTKKQRRRFLVGLLFGLVSGLVVAALLWVDPFFLSQWGYRNRDLLYSPYPVSGQTVIVAIDDTTLAAYGRLGDWPRARHAEVIERLHRAGARVIGLDIVFAGTVPDDPILIEALDRSGNVILSTLGEGQPNQSRAGLVGYPRILRPPSSLGEASLAMAHANVLTDRDNTVRRVPLLIEGDGQRHYALSLQVLAEFLRLPPLENSPQNERLTLGPGWEVPIDEQGGMLINYAGPPFVPDSTGNREPTFTVVSYLDVLEDRVAPKIFADKMVLVGVMATGEPDDHATPLSEGREMYGVEIHANAIETLLQGKHLRYQGFLSAVLVVIGLSLLGGLVWPHVRPLPGALLAGTAGLGYFLVATFAFDLHGVLLDMLYAYLAILLMYVTSLIYRIFCEEREKRQIIRLFNCKASPQVVQQIIRAAEEGTLRMDGVQQEATILFIDIRGYSQMAAELPPRKLLLVLNEYLRVAGQTLIQHEGTLSVYAGDAIMGIFNAPLPQSDHALRAVRAGLAIQEALAAFQTSPHGTTLCQVAFGVGICTGTVMVGNVGFAERYDYSAIGDAANLAFHITSGARPGEVLIGEGTFQQVKEEVATDSGRAIPIKGTRKTTTAYHVIACSKSRHGERAHTVSTSRSSPSPWWRQILIADSDD